MFDAVIVGARSAGCVLAARLSEDPGRRVCLVEAGEWPSDPRITDPLAWGRLQGSAIDWGYETVPQPRTAGRRHPWPRGRVVGGSSCLHAMAHVRGHPSDFDRWAEAGGPGWSYDALLPYFRKSERFSGGASALHGGDGPLDVYAPDAEVHALTRAYMAAGEAVGIAPTDEHNGARMDGPTVNQLTIRDGKRVSVADAYLAAARTRPNLTIRTGGVADRVLLERGRATGVEIVADGRRETVQAGEVVLSAGAIASPLILMRSGIGDPRQLAEAGIPRRIDLPAVGANLHDHLFAAGNLYRARRPVPPSRLQHSESLMYVRRSAAPGPNLVLACVTLPVAAEGFATPPAGEGYTILSGFTKPRSRGSVRLGGPGPLDPPRIDPAYLSDPADRAEFRDALRLAREVGHAAPLAEWRAEELLPGPAVASDADLDHFLARAAITHHHPVGTCRMGLDGVVDGELRVCGVDGLRVIDGSVIPEITTGPVNAAVVALAERAAGLLSRS